MVWGDVCAWLLFVWLACWHFSEIKLQVKAKWVLCSSVAGFVFNYVLSLAAI